jgi:hypothetical protein
VRADEGVRQKGGGGSTSHTPERRSRRKLPRATSLAFCRAGFPRVPLRVVFTSLMLVLMRRRVGAVGVAKSVSGTVADPRRVNGCEAWCGYNNTS